MALTACMLLFSWLFLIRAAPEVERAANFDFIKESFSDMCVNAVKNSFDSQGRCQCNWRHTVYKKDSQSSYECFSAASDASCGVNIEPSSLPILLVDLTSSSAPQLIGSLKPTALLQTICKDVTSLVSVEYWNDPSWVSVGPNSFIIESSSDLLWNTQTPHQWQSKFEGLLLRVTIRCKGTLGTSEQCALFKVLGKRSHPYDINAVIVPSSSPTVEPSTSPSPGPRPSSTVRPSSTIQSSSVIQPSSRGQPSSSQSITSTTVLEPKTSTDVTKPSSTPSVTPSVTQTPRPSSASTSQVGPSSTPVVPPQPTPSSNQTLSKGGSNAAVIGAVIAVIAILIIIGIGVGCYFKRRSSHPFYTRKAKTAASAKKPPIVTLSNGMSSSNGLSASVKKPAGLDNNGFWGSVKLGPINSKRHFNGNAVHVPPAVDEQLDVYELPIDAVTPPGSINSGHPFVSEPVQEDMYQEIGIYEQPIDHMPPDVSPSPVRPTFAPGPGGVMDPLYSVYEEGDQSNIYQSLDDCPYQHLEITNKSYERIDRNTLNRGQRPGGNMVYDEPEGMERSTSARSEPFYNELESGGTPRNPNASIYHHI